MKRRFGGELLPVWMPGNSRTAGCGSYVAGGGIVLRPDAGAAGAGKKRTAAGKKVTQLSFCMKNPVTGKVSCRRIRFDCIGRSATNGGGICAKKKGPRRVPTALGSGKPATPKNNAYPSGSGLYLNLQKIYQIYIV